MNENNEVLRFFSTLTGVILFFFVAASFADQAIFRIPIRIGAFSLVIPFQLFDLMNVLISTLTAVGVYALLSEHFQLSREERILRSFFPFSGALIMGVSLKNTSGGTAWWLILFFGGLLLFTVFLSVYTASDHESVWQPVSIILLTGLNGAIFLLGVIAVRTNVLRLVLEIPLLLFIAFSTAQSVFSLWLHKENIWQDSLTTAAIIGIMGMGLHYMPLNAISYGVLFFIWYYLFVSMNILMESDLKPENAALKQLPTLGVLVGIFLITLL